RGKLRINDRMTGRGYYLTDLSTDRLEMIGKPLRCTADVVAMGCKGTDTGKAEKLSELTYKTCTMRGRVVGSSHWELQQMVVSNVPNILHAEVRRANYNPLRGRVQQLLPGR